MGRCKEVGRHPAAIAWDKFVSENVGTFNVDTLGTTDAARYLQNRIAHAFNRGWDAAVAEFNGAANGRKKVRK